MPGVSATRWWSQWELIKQMMELFVDIESYLRTNENVPTCTRARLLEYFNNPQKLIYLKLETAIIVDVGIHFVKTMYNLEGDGPLMLSCYEKISALSAAIEQMFYPNTQAIVRGITADPNLQQQLMQYAKACVEPGIKYFNDCKLGAIAETLACFKAARLF